MAGPLFALHHLHEVARPLHIQLNVQEAEQIIQQPDIAEAEGLRDRVILKTFYSTGMRRMELAHLKVYDLDIDRKTLMIRLGKGRKDRVIPIGERALA
ncbi:MAG: tyrosine-type recombinase/integrase, partial [Bryobacteraceae bacterium]